jgi:hypothetical protein
MAGDEHPATAPKASNESGHQIDPVTDRPAEPENPFFHTVAFVKVAP